MVVIWSDLAKQHIYSIIDYIVEGYGSLISQKVYQKIIGHISLLSTFPCMGVHDARFEAEGLEVRYLINTPNIIHYLIHEDSIIIISVLDCRQSPEVIEKVVSEFMVQYK